MNKQELKTIIKDIRDFKAEGSLSQESLDIFTNDGQFFSINEFEVLPEKISINNIEMAIYTGETKGIYLKQGLKSYRKAMKANLI